MAGQTRRAALRAKMRAGDRLTGTFVKTPAHEVIEVLALSGLDFICLDAEHAPFDRGRMDACLAIAAALDLPALVRVGAGTPQDILQALDAGAVGIVVPHVDSPAKAAAVAKAARFGHGGRGFAGSTRWAGYATNEMAGLLDRAVAETIVLAQIEEPEGVEAIDEIAGTNGIDGVFVGPADLSVAYGKRDLTSNELKSAFARVGTAARARGVAAVTWVGDVAQAAVWARDGFNTFLIASEHAWMLAGARAAVAEMGKVET